MASDTVFAFRDYHAFIKHQVETHREQWGYITRMAKAAACQRSHLSKVINSHVHLTLDQAFALARFWKLGKSEEAFFMAMVEHARATHPVYREELAQRLRRLREEEENLTSRLEQKTTVQSTPEQMTYYTSWLWCALHVLTSIPKYQTLAAISERLSLPPAQIQKALQWLESQRYVRRQGERWILAGPSLHLPRDSALISLHHSNWRGRAALSSQFADPKSVHYTVVQSLSLEDSASLRRQILAWIDEYHRTADPSKEEELYCFSCDFFQV